MDAQKTLTIIILTYNVKDLTIQCIESVLQASKALMQLGKTVEIIVTDNASTDGTVAAVRAAFPTIRIFENANVGFAKGNNAVRNYVNSEYVLILNPDTSMKSNTLSECLQYMQQHVDVGALTCKTVLSNGLLDKDARRTFPYPLVALSHFSGLDRIFPKSKIFSKYWYGYLSEDETHEVDVIQGAFSLVRKKVLDQVDWYDEDYFLDGEDIDLCWKIKEKGHKVIYFPKVSITHYKGASKGKASEEELNKKVAKSTKIRSTIAGSDSMKIFYDKHFKIIYGPIVTFFVYIGIWLLKLKRVVSILLRGKR